MRRILVAGAPFSGVPWVFDACRLLAVKHFNYLKVNASKLKEYTFVPDMAVEVLCTTSIPSKPVEYDKLVLCVRDLRDTFCEAVQNGMLEVASYAFNGMTDGVKQGIELALVAPAMHWRDKADLIIRYEQAAINRIGALAMLDKVLFPEIQFEDTGPLQNIAMATEIAPFYENAYGDFDPKFKGKSLGIGLHLCEFDYGAMNKIMSDYKDWFSAFNYTDLYQTTGGILE